MKVGDLVRQQRRRRSPKWRPPTAQRRLGLIIEVINDHVVSPTCVVLYASGDIEEEWSDQLELINEGR